MAKEHGVLESLQESEREKRRGPTGVVGRLSFSFLGCTMWRSIHQVGTICRTIIIYIAVASLRLTLLILEKN